MALSSDGGAVAAGGYAEPAGKGYEHPIRLWDVRTTKELATLRGEGSFLRGLAFAPDGKTMASGGDDMIIRLWKLESE